MSKWAMIGTLESPWKCRWPLTPYDRDAFWGGTHYHYSDYQPYDTAQSA
jgi:hypothetical protein